MARDLIPPPSPAGRPDPDAVFSSSKALREPPADDPLEPPEDEAIEPLPESSFRARFGMVVGALVGFGVAAATVLVLVLSSDPGPEPAWSAFKPRSDDRNIQIIEIARAVARQYRLDDGDQLNRVDAEPLELDGAALRVVVRSTGKGEGANIDEIDGRTVLYTLKGLGPQGSIDSGKPSESRLRLLQREATELALYTFTYVDGFENVVAVLPPPSPADGEDAPDAATGEIDGLRAMLFSPGDLERELRQPLAATFPGETPRPSTISAQDIESMRSFSVSHLFIASLTTDQLGSGVLVLDRESASETLREALRPDEEG